MGNAPAVFLSTLVAPITPGLLFVFGTPITRESILHAPDILSLLGLFAIGYFFGLVATVLIGLPVFALLHTVYKVRLWTSCLVGFLIGLVGAVVIRMPNIPASKDFLITCSVGMISSITFYLVWKILTRTKRGLPTIRR